MGELVAGADKADRQRLHDADAAKRAAVERRVRNQAAFGLMRQRFPAAFTTPMPLALCVQRQLRDAIRPAASDRALRSALSWWTTRQAYLEAVVRGGACFDLLGNVAGAITPEQQALATGELARRRPACA